MVEVNGFEPMASCVQGRRSPSWATPPIVKSENRTALYLDIQASNLSCERTVVGLDGVEPSTSRLSGVRSNQTELQAQGNFEYQISDFGYFIFLSKIQILNPKSDWA